MNQVGIGHGRCRGQVGYFKMSLVEILPESYAKKDPRTKRHPAAVSGSSNSGKGGSLTQASNRQSTVEELLFRIGLKEYASVFILNGYEDLELFRELEPADLDYLGIMNVDHRGKILTAVQLLHDMDCEFPLVVLTSRKYEANLLSLLIIFPLASDYEIAGSSSENDEALRSRNQSSTMGVDQNSSSSPFGRRHFPRDSGCYEGSPLPTQQPPASDPHSLDDVVIQCSKEIQKRMEQARRLKEENCLQMRSNTINTTTSKMMKKSGLLGGGQIQTLYGTDSDSLVMMRGSNSSGGGALSEKSSDSGVSSSSLSSGAMKNHV